MPRIRTLGRALLGASALWCALAGTAHACGEAVEEGGRSTVCEPDEPPRCAATATTGSDGSLHLTQHAEQDGTSGGTTRSCAVAWLRIERPRSDFVVELQVVRAEVTRTDAVVTAPSETAGVAFAWAGAEPPPPVEGVDDCAPDGRFADRGRRSSLSGRRRGTRRARTSSSPSGPTSRPAAGRG